MEFETRALHAGQDPEPITGSVNVPIFQTTTKANPDPEVGLDGLRAVREIVGDIPLVAIGGITPANAAAVLDAGADSVALVSALLSRGPEAISVRFRTLMQNLSPRQT